MSDFIRLAKDPRPQCPYCGKLAPYGEERLSWLERHLDSRLHRWWHNLKRKM